ncbi:MAG: Na+/H+ antiporter subunit E [Caldiserica bacterium]|nr:Na+/H+ antiporter subunit E [Caldisericota bacterium]
MGTREGSTVAERARAAIPVALVGGGALWGIWILLWRSTSVLVLVSGMWCPIALFSLSVWSGLGTGVPRSVWTRPDLWAAFLLLFLWGVARGVIRTAASILRARYSPGIIAIPVRVRSDLGKLLLVLAITASPGTIAILVEEEILYVHCLQLPERPELPGVGALQRILVKLTG